MNLRFQPRSQEKNNVTVCSLTKARKSIHERHVWQAKRTERNSIGQAKKGIRWMPWHWEPKKDVTSCEKLR